MSNLLKRFATYVDASGRIINTNELVAKRIEELSMRTWQNENQEMESGGFVSGLVADDVSSLFAEGTEGDSGIIKGVDDALMQAEQAREEAESILAAAREEAEHLLLTTRAQAEDERTKVLKTAEEQGYRKGYEQAMREGDNLKRQLEEEKKALDEKYRQQIETYEPTFIDTITGIYEHIFHVDLHSYRDILVHLITGTIHKVEMSYEFVVRVSKEDYPYVSMQKKQIAASVSGSNGSVAIIEDVTLRKNECLIETDGGIFDCSLDTQLEELGKKMKLLAYKN